MHQEFARVKVVHSRRRHPNGFCQALDYCIIFVFSKTSFPEEVVKVKRRETMAKNAISIEGGANVKQK